MSDPRRPVRRGRGASGPGRHPVGPVNILVNNASGWLADTFVPAGTDQLGRSLQRVTADTWRQQFSVDTMAAALMIAEFARRTPPGARPGPDHRPPLGRGPRLL